MSFDDRLVWHVDEMKAFIADAHVVYSEPCARELKLFKQTYYNRTLLR
jgi:hypothetical protein